MRRNITKLSYSYMYIVYLPNRVNSNRGLTKGNSWIEAFWKSPYLNVTFCIDLKIGSWHAPPFFSLLLRQLGNYLGTKKYSRFLPPFCTPMHEENLLPFHFSCSSSSSGSCPAVSASPMRLDTVIEKIEWMEPKEERKYKTPQGNSLAPKLFSHFNWGAKEIAWAENLERIHIHRDV